MTHLRNFPLLTLSSLFLYSSMVVQVLAQDPQSRTVTFEGVVRPLSEIAKSRKITSDSETLAGLMALETKDGRAIPLLSDEGGRMYYLDEAMRGRQVRLKMIERPDFPVAEVIQSEVMHEGRWRVPQYYCDVCTIAVRYPQVCLCCQGPMEFRFRPER